MKLAQLLFGVLGLTFVGGTICRLESQWSSDPTVNTPICTAPNDQINSTIVSDGAGGEIITWTDFRGSTFSDIYAQRLNAAGVVQWTANGVPISTASNSQADPTMVSDGAGGAIITWDDNRTGGANSQIYAQRVNAAGIRQWIVGSDSNGVAISMAMNGQYFPKIVSDSAGGAIITWQDGRSGTSTDIYAQRVNAAGVVQWEADGVPISTAAHSQTNPKIVNDGVGGAIITWTDNRNGLNYQIYAQRINTAGVRQWIVGGDSNGVAISTPATDVFYPTSVSDGAGGAIITWFDYRGGTYSDIYAQRVNAAGIRQWIVGADSNGVVISNAARSQTDPTITSDGVGGAIITWNDLRGNGNAAHIYAQRVNAAGTRQWIVSGDSNGVAISTAGFFEANPTIASDGASGAIITWDDDRNIGNYDIYAQRVNAAGVVQWTADGVPISAAINVQAATTIFSDGDGGQSSHGTTAAVGPLVTSTHRMLILTDTWDLLYRWYFKKAGTLFRFLWRWAIIANRLSFPVQYRTHSLSRAAI